MCIRDRIGHEVDEAYYKEVMGIEINPGMDKSGFKIVFLSLIHI